MWNIFFELDYVCSFITAINKRRGADTIPRLSRQPLYICTAAAPSGPRARQAAAERLHGVEPDREAEDDQVGPVTGVMCRYNGLTVTAAPARTCTTRGSANSWERSGAHSPPSSAPPTSRRRTDCASSTWWSSRTTSTGHASGPGGRRGARLRRVRPAPLRPAGPAPPTTPPSSPTARTGRSWTPTRTCSPWAQTAR